MEKEESGMNNVHFSLNGRVFLSLLSNLHLLQLTPGCSLRREEGGKERSSEE